MSGRSLVVLLAVVLGAVVAAPAAGHNEREAVFPDGSGSVPQYRPMIADPHLVVCSRESARRIARIDDTSLRKANQALFPECRFNHIQDAVNAVTQPNTTIYVLPGEYREDPYRAEPECAEQFEEPEGGGTPIMSYEEQRDCPHAQNLIGIFGDTDDDGQRECNGPLCGLQLEGTGERPGDVLIHGGFDEHGEFEKLNGFRADRADGVYFKNFTVELFEFNSLYVIETDGFVIDEVVGRWNDEYAFLTFAVDHGLYTNCEGYGNGDSAIYPGSASDVNSDKEGAGITRWAVEIRGCSSHHNLLGYSGTAGNSVYAHDNEFFANSTGVSMDSLFPDHPGLPQDHAWFENNRIYSNNVNYFPNVQEGGVCRRPPAERGYEQGTVCPNFPAPVGSGILVAGGNDNLFERNRMWDNWRHAFVQFNVPAFLREETDPERQFDTSHRNEYLDNVLDVAADGSIQRNGDPNVWWDDQGVGNCWEGNTTADGPMTSNALFGLPDCRRRSGTGRYRPFAEVPNPVKSAEIAPCATYDRHDNPDPPGCPWMKTPSRPQN
jgi:hypothetical protein